MINIQDYQVVPVANKVEISYMPYEIDGYCDVLITYYYDDAIISHSTTNLTGTQLEWVLASDFKAADNFVLQRLGITQL